MADRMDIPLIEATWNPVTGCSPVSPGCRRCYARGFAARLAGRCGSPRKNPFAANIHENRFMQPKRGDKTRHAFVCSMGHLFHADVSGDLRGRIFRPMVEDPQSTYRVITKRAEAMIAMFDGSGPKLVEPLRKALWMGLSIENQKRADSCVPPLLSSSSGLRLVCTKPLLDAVDPLLDAVDPSPWLGGAGGVDGVICGGETDSGGVAARAEHKRPLHDRCPAAKAPFYKAWGGPNRRPTSYQLDGGAREQMPEPPQAPLPIRNLSTFVSRTALRLVLWALCIAMPLAPPSATLAAQAVPPSAETQVPSTSEERACPLTTPTYAAHLETTEFTGNAGRPVFIRMRLEPPDVPPGFYVTSLAEVLDGPPEASGTRRPRILTGFPAIRFTADVPGVYRLDVRVNLIAKSSCGGVKASPLLEKAVTISILP